jgi:hypothetical protein
MTIAQTGATDASQAPTSHDRVDVWERMRGRIAFAILLAIFITAVTMSSRFQRPQVKVTD